jgi:AraC family transcriptional regulator, transcriptional activator of pobA
MPRPQRSDQPIYSIPAFGLYGNAAEPSPARYAHIETIAHRAPVYDWSIGSHRHADLAQFILVTHGGGELELEGSHLPFAAPWFVWLPTGVVHGFRFVPGTAGLVLSVSVDVVAGAIALGADSERLAAVASEARYGELPTELEIGIDVKGTMHALMREQQLPRSGIDSAVSANLLTLLVALLRTRTLHSLDEHLGKAQASEFRRFREFIERSFREQRSVAHIAAWLGITPHRLHSIAVRAVGKGPLAIQHDRIMLECKRELMYTDRSISEIAFDCGFKDPAHFSRFFSQRAGCSPRTYRAKFKSDP